MKNKPALIVSALLTGFVLVVLGGVVARTETETATEPDVAAEVVAGPKSDPPAVALLTEREATTYARGREPDRGHGRDHDYVDHDDDDDDDDGDDDHDDGDDHYESGGPALAVPASPEGARSVRPRPRPRPDAVGSASRRR